MRLPLTIKPWRCLTHAEFAAGAQGGTIGFKCLLGEPQQFITGARKAIFNVFVLLCCC
jgi:hypothetical protein